MPTRCCRGSGRRRPIRACRRCWPKRSTTKRREAAAAAAGALGEVGDREALAPLLRALGREEAVAHAAADALGRLGARHYDEVRVLVQSRGLGGPDAPLPVPRARRLRARRRRAAS